MYEANGFEMTSIPQPLLRPQMTFFSSFIIFQMKTTSELREALPLEALLEEGEKLKKHFNFNSDFGAKKCI